MLVTRSHRYCHKGRKISFIVCQLFVAQVTSGCRVFKDFNAPSGHIMEKLVPETLAHLTESHLEYFSKWSKLLLLESSLEAKWKSLRDLWTKSIKQRFGSTTILNKKSVE